MKKKENILLLDGGGTQTLSIAESLYKLGHCLYTFYSRKLSYGYATKYIKHKTNISAIKNNAEFLLFTKTYLVDNKIDVIIPMSDNSAEFLSKNKTELSKYSRFIIPDYDIFLQGYNKNLLMKICAENNFFHPKTIDLSNTSSFERENFPFPAMLKPNFTTGGRGMTKVYSIEELNNILESTINKYGECHLQEFIEEGGKQYKVQLFVDEKCNLIQSSVIYKQRYYPVNAGSSCCNVTVENNELVTLCYSILKIINWQGFADFDLIEDPKDGIIKVMEINPRIPACIKSAIKSGANYGKIIAEYSLGKQTTINNDYKFGKKLRHIGFEILWFFYSKNRFKTKPNWFNFFDKNLSFQDFSWKDPLPFFYGTIGNIKKQSNSEFRKSKSGTR